MEYRIRDIRNFVEISACATIIQAAKKLEISQPALSESLKRLESDLGYILFYRSRSGIQLTPGGKVFLSKAHKVIESLNDLNLNKNENAIFAGRTIIIGCHATVAQYFIPKALSYLKEKAPDYKIELRHDLSRNIQNEVQKGNIDVGIIINPTPVPDIVLQKLAVDIFAVWSLKSNKELDTIICNPDLYQVQSILKRWKNKPEKIITTNSFELTIQLIEEKIGCGILPERAVKLSKAPLVLRSHLPTFKDDFALVYRPEFGKSAAEKLTVEAIRKAVNENS